MKISHIIPATIAATAIATTGFAAKDDSSKYNRNDQSKQASAHSQYDRHDQSAMGSQRMHRVTQDSLDRQVTAKDLIGASVYDNAGEKIGDIADIGISGLPSSLNKGHMDKDRKENKGTHLPDANSQWGELDQSMQSQSSMRSQSMQGQGRVTAFISVGGLFGIGDDIVAVPANELSWDARKERFTLASTKSQVVALAEQEPIDFDSADDSQGYYSAKQSFDDDVTLVRGALISGDNATDLASVTVEKKDDRIVLKGTVKSEEAKKRAAELAEENSDLQIENSIKVRKY
ncbi:PRC-barrel domain-containing protein [Pelagicoccus sp. SDUM812005]|uniref:PRC-barrel domain-containing protein n=1 Tax=Pelagicoccus sp. SDUM812005 TaxID=3041257 RepID=UPI00280DF8EF|nr:PRC-barrel domain-containing protein [Pelagicoccus sp. SDUM812005]MDQ8181082.1 PRC-barrel domain-containing protein [Pelagicoccus sp. SDUM812005]